METGDERETKRKTEEKKSAGKNNHTLVHKTIWISSKTTISSFFSYKLHSSSELIHFGTISNKKGAARTGPSSFYRR